MLRVKYVFQAPAAHYGLRSKPMPIRAAIEDFVERLHALVESEAIERARAAVLNAFGAAPPKRRGRPPKALAAVTPAKILAPAKRRKKAPRQLCPVPGCQNPAPTLNMRAPWL